MSDTIDKPICATCVRLREGFCDGEHRMSKGSCDFYKRMTNADRIRAMTDEELAKFIPLGPCPPNRWHRDGFGARYTECPNEERFHGCHDCWLDWLKQEVSDGSPKD